MQLLDFIKREAKDIPKSIYWMSGLSGLANSAVLAFINQASEAIAQEQGSTKELLLFSASIAIYLYCLRYSFSTASHIFEKVLNQLRVRLVGKILRADLETVEGMGRSAIYNNLVQDLETISQSQSMLVTTVQSGIMLCATSLYLMMISFPGFLVVSIMFTATVFYYMEKQKNLAQSMQVSVGQNIIFMDHVNQILDGFNEVKMSRKRTQALNSEAHFISGKIRGANMKTMDIYNYIYIFGQCFMYFMMATVVFVLPKFIDTPAESITELTASILFVIGPLGALVGSLPALSKGNVAAINIELLETQLDKLASQAGTESERIQDFSDFSSISLQGAAYAYKDNQGASLFQVGPLDLEIKRGETLFIVGGNGSGKSTFMKFLTALHPVHGGRLQLDGIEITRENSQNYRELFSIIFGDFHLFKKLYGLEGIDAELVRNFLKKMDLEKKTTFTGDSFSNTDLSSGQRKRLALIISYLEDRPIYVFDEWAADQDPEFRRYFYEVLLTDLKSKGKTVIAVSHDDRYFHVADRVLHMDYGQIERIYEPKPKPKQPSGEPPD